MWPPRPISFRRSDARLAPCGLPHSGIPGSLDVRSSPGPFAACRALLRRTAPRHPPWTCSRLTILSLPRPQAWALGRPSFFASCLSSLPWQCQRTRARRRLVLEIRGFEPLTPGLQSRCSSQLSYIPFFFGEAPSPGTLERRESGKKTARSGLGRTPAELPFSQKGGDPAAPSGTTTLLRLHPPHEANLRHGPPCG